MAVHDPREFLAVLPITKNRRCPRHRAFHSPQSKGPALTHARGISPLPMELLGTRADHSATMQPTERRKPNFQDAKGTLLTPHMCIFGADGDFERPYGNPCVVRRESPPCSGAASVARIFVSLARLIDAASWPQMGAQHKTKCPLHATLRCRRRPRDNGNCRKLLRKLHRSSCFYRVVNSGALDLKRFFQSLCHACPMLCRAKPFRTRLLNPKPLKP